MVQPDRLLKSLFRQFITMLFLINTIGIVMTIIYFRSLNLLPDGRTPLDYVSRPVTALLFLTLAAVVADGWYISRQISGLRALQTDLVDRNRRDSLQLLRIQNNLNSIGLAMHDMLDSDEPYPLSAWSAQSMVMEIASSNVNCGPPLSPT